MPILKKNFIKHNGNICIKCGEELIEYNPNFRLYITTCLKNPNLSPEIMIVVGVII